MERGRACSRLTGYIAVVEGLSGISLPPIPSRLSPPRRASGFPACVTGLPARAPSIPRLRWPCLEIPRARARSSPCLRNPVDIAIRDRLNDSLQ